MKFGWLLALTATALANDISLPSYPLAIKTPYLSAWLHLDQSHDVPSAQPYFWAGQALTWQVFGRINNDAYCLFSCTNTTVTAAQQTSLSFTSTRTTMMLKAGAATFTLDFFSPVSPTNYVRQSMPYSYLTVSVSGVPRGATVGIMSEIDNTWTGQGNNVQAFFSQSRGGAHIFTLNGTQSYTYAENSDMAAWGNVILAASSNSRDIRDISYQIGSGPNNAAQFANNGILTGAVSSYTPSDNLAIAYHLDDCAGWEKSRSATFAIGVEQEEAFNSFGVPLTGYYRATVSGTEDVVDYFFADEAAARAEGAKFDQEMIDMGKQISQNYSDILEASVRQIFGAFEILIPLETLDTSQATAWMKEMSTDGNVQTIADLLPKSFPIFYAVAPDIMRLLLNPVLDYALTWPADFGFHDLGKHYPNATGETVATQEALIVDQTAVMHWMVYAYQKASGDTEYAKPYIGVLQKFADYLVVNGLYVSKQSSSVDSIGPTANQTVLAMYSAIALTSFGAITGMDNYTTVGKHFADVIMQQGVNDSHVTAHFGDPASSWISTYPMGFDMMLGLNTFNATTYKMQSDWYATVTSTYGMPFFSDVTYAVGDLIPWCAVTSTNEVRDALIGGIHAFLTDGMNNSPGPTRWYVTGSDPAPGTWPGISSINKPTAGAYWILAGAKLY